MVDGVFMSTTDYKHVTERKKRTRKSPASARGRVSTPRNQPKAGFNKMQLPQGNMISGQEAGIPEQASNQSGFVPVSSHQQMLQQPQPANIQQPQPSILASTQHMSQNHFIITPPRQHPQNTQPLTLPANFPTSQLQELIGKYKQTTCTVSYIHEIPENSQVNHDFQDSIRMLVFLACGEQRLITFTLPREQCTIQEILEQVISGHNFYLLTF